MTFHKFELEMIVFRMELDKTRCSCPWNSDQKLYTKLCQGLVGVKGGGRVGVVGSRG